MTPEGPRRRRLDGWGFVGEGFAPSGAMLDWLGARIEAGDAYPRFGDDVPALTAAGALPELPGEVWTDDFERLSHARGQARQAVTEGQRRGTRYGRVDG